MEYITYLLFVRICTMYTRTICKYIITPQRPLILAVVEKETANKKHTMRGGERNEKIYIHIFIYIKYKKEILPFRIRKLHQCIHSEDLRMV